MSLKTWKFSYPNDIHGSRRFHHLPLGINTLSISRSPGKRAGVIWWGIYVNGSYVCESPDLHHAFRRFREHIAAVLARRYADVS